MRRVVLLLGAVASLGAAQASLSTPTSARMAPIMVHCRAGDVPGFVTPARLEIALGDSVEWRMAGNVASDSIIITPKDPEQAWPFADTPSRGGATARANTASIAGLYRYNVTLHCRAPGGGTRLEVIDPDIIIGA